MPTDVAPVLDEPSRAVTGRRRCAIRGLHQRADMDTWVLALAILVTMLRASWEPGRLCWRAWNLGRSVRIVVVLEMVVAGRGTAAIAAAPQVVD